jgi:hypothetical protein
MEPPPRALDAKTRARAARLSLAAIAYAVLAVSLLSPVQPAVTKTRLERLGSALRGDPTYRPENMGFWFDADYLAFLDDLDRRLPKTPALTVAVLVPRNPDLYRFQANYRLAPRRVVEERWKDEADVVATYRTEAGRGPGGEPVAGGWLWTRPSR